MNNLVLTTFTEISINIRKSIQLKLIGMNQKSYLKMPEENNTIPKAVLLVNFNIIILLEEGVWRWGPTRKEK